MAWTTDDLISEVRRRLRLPSTADSGGVQDSDILASANRSYLTQMLPFLRSMMEGYGQIESDVTIVADQSDYDVPSNLLGGTFDDLLMIDSSGNEQSVEHIPPTLAHVYRASGRWAYSLIGGGVRISPTPTTAIGSLRFKGIERVTLVASARGAQATSAPVSDRYVYVDAAPSVWTGSQLRFDFRSPSPPFGATYYNVGTASFDSGTQQIDFGASGLTDYPNIAIDDWATLTGESIVIPIPDVLHYALASAVAQVLAVELGQSETASTEAAAFGQEMRAAREALLPRAKGERRPIVNRHSPSRARRRRGR